MTSTRSAGFPDLTYRDAGVDLDRKEGFLERVRDLARRTWSGRVLDRKEGYAGAFALGGDGPLFDRALESPVLVACCDGVGTKVRVASMARRFDTVGIDLVAMSANDLVCTGASPLFFLDYLAVPRLEEKAHLEIVRGVARGCAQAGCALLGGETSEMPGHLPADSFELAGFMVGIAEADRLIDGSAVAPGDAIVGVASGGIHANGFSLARKVFFDTLKLPLDARLEGLDRPLGEELLLPTRIYARAVQAVLRPYRRKRVVKGIAHVAGGGIPRNLARILPKRCAAVLRAGSWEVPPVFRVLEDRGGIGRAEMFRVFNMGLGLILVVHPFYAAATIRRLRRAGERAWIVGSVRPGKGEVILEDP